MKNNDLDKFIKGKLDEPKFEYNPADWENALKLIAKEDNKERPLWIWWAAAGIVLLLVGAMALSQLTNNNTNQLSEVKEEIRTENSLKGDQTLPKASVTDNNENNIEKNNQVQIEDALMAQTDNSVSKNTNRIAVQKEVVPKTTSLKTENINLPDPISGNTPKLQPISSPVSDSVADDRAGEDFSLSEAASKNQGADQPTTEKTEIVSEYLSRDQVYDRSSTLLLTALKPLNATSFQPESFEWETPYAPQRIKPVSDPEMKLGFGWGASAFVNPYVANLDGSSKEITGFSGGLTALYRLDRTLSVNADFLYTYKTGTFETSNLSQTRRYSFEALDGISSLNPKALHYLSMPIYVGLHIGKHRVTAGGSLNYLAAVRGDVRDQTVDGSGNVLNETLERGWIAKDGFTQFNPGALIGYDFNISNRWTVSFRSNYMFKSIIDKALSEEINSFIIKENSQVNLQIGSTFYFR